VDVTERIGQQVQVAVLEDLDAAEVGCLLDRDQARLDEADPVVRCIRTGLVDMLDDDRGGGDGAIPERIGGCGRVGRLGRMAGSGCVRTLRHGHLR